MQLIRGTKDIFGDNIIKYNKIVNLAKNISELYNFKEIKTPVIEFTEIFERNLGETSDVVSKEIYKFQDRSGNDICLRPEFTAGIVRAILTNSELRDKFPIRLFSYGSNFRYDRPQKGRYREFNQINFESFGNPDYVCDFDIIYMANQIIERLGISNYKLEINSLGSDESRNNFENSIKNYFNRYKKDLSEDSKIRLEKNVLRILDSKDENDRKLLKSAPKISDFYTDKDRKFLDCVVNMLSKTNINFEVNTNLVRGLDYYTSTVFEFTTNDLGAQSTIFAGGRYDKLVKQMGGPDIPAFGCAAGIERLMLLIENKEEVVVRPISIVPITDKEIDYCINIQNILRENGFSVEMHTYVKMKKKMDNANKILSKFVVIVGEDEVKNNKINLKNLDNGNEESINLSELVKFLSK